MKQLPSTINIDLNILIAARSLLDSIISELVNTDNDNKECEHLNKIIINTMGSKPGSFRCKDCGFVKD